MIDAPLGHGPWAVAPRFFVRSSGVPFERIELLGPEVDQAEAALQGWLAADRAVEAAAVAAQRALDGAALDRQRLGRLRRHLGRRAPLPEALRASLSPPLIEAVSRYQSALAAREAAAAGLAAPYDALRRRSRRRLWAALADPVVRGGIALLSPEAARRLIRAPDLDRPEGAKYRKLDRLLYLYLQRLCTKAESTSDVGPVGTGRIEGAGAVEYTHGPQLALNRRTYPSGWIVRRAAAVAAARLGPWLPLRAPADVFTEGGRLCRYVQVDPFERRLVELGPEALVEPWRAAQGLTLRVAQADPALWAQVAPLLAAGALTTTPVVPRQRRDGLLALAAQLETSVAPEAPGRADTLDDLRALSQIIADFASTPAEARPEALAALCGEVEARLGQPAYRGAGQMYADRLPFFEDCARDLPRFTVGAEILDAMAPLGEALELWLGAGVDQRLYLADAHHRWRLARWPEAEAGAAIPVPALLAALDTLADDPGEAAAHLRAVGRLRPQPVVPKAIRAALAEGIEAVELPLSACPGRRGAEPALASCDVHLIPPQAAGERWRVVLGEGHAMICAFQFFIDGQPEGAAMIEDIDRLSAWAAGSEALLKTYDTWDAKLSYRHLSPAVVDFDPGAEGPPERAAVGWGDLRLRYEAEGWALEIRQGDQWRRGRFLFQAPWELGPEHALAGVAVQGKGLPGPGAEESPRLTDGGLTLLRRQWRLAPSPIAALARGPRHLRYARLHRLLQARGLPRYVFLKSEAEPKPLWLDTLDPVAADLLISMAGATDRPLTISEMLPSPDQLWLRDDRGRYVCELRLNLSRDVARDRPQSV